MTENQPRKPTKVQAPEGCSDYLTPGKIYEVEGFWGKFDSEYGHRIKTINDFGHNTLTSEKKSPHLNNQDWIVVEREGDNEKLQELIQEIPRIIPENIQDPKRFILVREFSKVMTSWGNIFRSEANRSLIENPKNNREYDELIEISDACHRLSEETNVKP